MTRRTRLGLAGFLILGSAWPVLAFDRIEVTVAPRRPEPGDSVIIRIQAAADGGEVRASLLRPAAGETELALEPKGTDARTRRGYACWEYRKADAPSRPGGR